MKISACLIAKNEERCIARCINSFKRICGEIIVGDTGSDDNTAEIARGLGATVIDVPWEDDFSKARNAVFEKCTGDWVILLDADEYFRPGDDLRLKGLIRSIHHDTRITMLYIPMWCYDKETYTPEQLCAMEPTAPAAGITTLFHYRVARKVKDMRYIMPIHEMLVIWPKGAPSQIPINYLKIGPETAVILHDGYSVAMSREKNERNHRLLEREIEHGEHSARLFYYAAQSAGVLGMNDKRREYLKKYIEFEEPMMVYGILGHIEYRGLLKSGNASLREVHELIESAERVYPGHPVVFGLWAEFWQKLLMRQKVLDFRLKQEKAQNEYSSDFYTLSTTSLKDDVELRNFPKIFCSMADIYLQSGDFDSAALYYSKSLDRNISHSPALKGYLLTTRALSASDVAGRLFGWYSAKNPDEAAFALNHLRKYRADEVFMLYFEKWFSGKEDENLLTLMALVGEHQSAVLKFMKKYASSQDTGYLAKACSIALLHIEKQMLFTIAPSGYSPVFSRFYGQDAAAGSGQDAGFLMDVAEELISLGGDNPSVVLYMHILADTYGNETCYRLGAVMEDMLYLTPALDLYEKAAEMPPLGESFRAKCLLGAAKCAYMLGQFEKAIDCFNKAVSLGASRAGLEDYGIWMEGRWKEGSKKARQFRKEMKLDIDYSLPYNNPFGQMRSVEAVDIK